MLSNDDFYPTSPNYCLCTTRGNAEITSFLSHAVLVHCQTLTIAGLIYSVLLQLMLLQLCGFLNIVITGVKLCVILGP